MPILMVLKLEGKELMGKREDSGVSRRDRMGKGVTEGFGYAWKLRKSNLTR